MTKIFLITLLLIGLNSFSQNTTEFEPGVEIIQSDKISEYESPKSILFVFEGHTHMINNFLDLKKHIRKAFKKRMKSDFKSFLLDFNYNLTAEKSMKEDMEKIPSKKYRKEKYETICYISVTDIKGWDEHLIEKRKQNYILNADLKDKDLNELLQLKLKVNSYYTITTENKNSSSLIYQTIMENK